MGQAPCSLRFVGNGLPLDAIAGALDLRDARFRDDLAGPPDWDGVARRMTWSAFWQRWDVPQPRVHRIANPTAEAIARLLDHLEARADALQAILTTRDARAEVYVYYTQTREVMSVLPPEIHARLGALGLGTRIEVTDDLG